MCGFHSHLHSQSLHHFHIVSHSISTSSLFCFCFDLITDPGWELLNVLFPSSRVITQHIVLFAIWSPPIASSARNMFIYAPPELCNHILSL